MAPRAPDVAVNAVPRTAESRFVSTLRFEEHRKKEESEP
jgi:hypothetical protein